MISKPLTLLGQECVLQYMDANQRFQFSHRCPTVSPIDKRVPLIVSHLEMEENRLTINDTVYQLGVYQQYPTFMVVPENIVIQNEEYGDQVDLDRYGLPSRESGSGSLLFKEAEEELKDLDYTKDLMARWRARHGSEYDIAKDTTTAEIRWGIDERETRLKPYILKRDNAQPPWRLLLKISVINENRVSRVEFGEYTNLQQNLTQLVDRFFGQRKPPVKVETWVCEFWAIPTDLKLQVQEFTSWEHPQDLERIQQHIHESSHPLDLVQVPGVYRPYPEMVKNAKEIVLHKGIPMEFLSEFKCMELEMSGEDLNLEKYSQLVRHWIESEKPIGTCFKFIYRSSQQGILYGLELQFNGRRNGSRFLKIPMNSSSEIEVWNRALMRPSTPWGLMFKVVAVGNNNISFLDFRF